MHEGKKGGKYLWQVWKKRIARILDRVILFRNILVRRVYIVFAIKFLILINLIVTSEQGEKDKC